MIYNKTREEEKVELDPFEELSNEVSELVRLIFLYPKSEAKETIASQINYIRKYMLSHANVIGNKILEDVKQLDASIALFLDNPNRSEITLKIKEDSQRLRNEMRNL